MHDPLNGLSDVDWASLRHAYGSAEKIPEWLTGPMDPKIAAQLLDTSIYHQGGTVYSAAAQVGEADPFVPGIVRVVAATPLFSP